MPHLSVSRKFMEFLNFSRDYSSLRATNDELKAQMKDKLYIQSLHRILLNDHDRDQKDLTLQKSKIALLNKKVE